MTSFSITAVCNVSPCPTSLCLCLPYVVHNKTISGPKVMYGIPLGQRGPRDKHARHCAKHFTYISFTNPHNNLICMNCHLCEGLESSTGMTKKLAEYDRISYNTAFTFLLQITSIVLVPKIEKWVTTGVTWEEDSIKMGKSLKGTGGGERRCKGSSC